MPDREHETRSPAQWDERDADEQHAPVAPIQPSFDAPADLEPTDGTPPSADLLARTVTVVVANRALRNEAVPGCRVTIGARTATTNPAGAATLDLTGLGAGWHAVDVQAADVFAGPVGPGFPADTSKERIWRPFAGRIRIEADRLVEAEPPQWLVLTAAGLRAGLAPVWLRSPQFSGRPGRPDMIVIHHTAGTLEGDLRTFLYGGQVSIHYLVAPNGEVYKLVNDDQKASHAGYSYWQGNENLNGTSIGIELTHQTGVEYPTEQIDSVVELVRRLKAAFPTIPAARVVAHSDIGVCEPTSRNPCNPPSPKRLGRKSTDPGSAFPWERIEALGLSFQFTGGTVSPDIYGGFFRQFPGERLRQGDNDAERRYGGAVRSGVSGAIVALQTDLARLGYFCPQDGDYGRVTAIAVQMFQQHVFSGKRRTGRPNQWNSGDGTLDRATAQFLKRGLGETQGAFGSALSGATHRQTTPLAPSPRRSAWPMLLGAGAVALGLALLWSAASSRQVARRDQGDSRTSGRDGER